MQCDRQRCSQRCSGAAVRLGVAVTLAERRGPASAQATCKHSTQGHQRMPVSWAVGSSHASAARQLYRVATRATHSFKASSAGVWASGGVDAGVAASVQGADWEASSMPPIDTRQVTLKRLSLQQMPHVADNHVPWIMLLLIAEPSQPHMQHSCSGCPHQNASVWAKLFSKPSHLEQRRPSCVQGKEEAWTATAGTRPAAKGSAQPASGTHLEQCCFALGMALTGAGSCSRLWAGGQGRAIPLLSPWPNALWIAGGHLQNSARGGESVS